MDMLVREGLGGVGEECVGEGGAGRGGEECVGEGGAGRSVLGGEECVGEGWGCWKGVCWAERRGFLFSA